MRAIYNALVALAMACSGKTEGRLPSPPLAAQEARASTAQDAPLESLEGMLIAVEDIEGLGLCQNDAYGEFQTSARLGLLTIRDSAGREYHLLTPNRGPLQRPQQSIKVKYTPLPQGGITAQSFMDTLYSRFGDSDDVRCAYGARKGGKMLRDGYIAADGIVLARHIMYPNQQAIP